MQLRTLITPGLSHPRLACGHNSGCQAPRALCFKPCTYIPKPCVFETGMTSLLQPPGVVGSATPTIPPPQPRTQNVEIMLLSTNPAHLPRPTGDTLVNDLLLVATELFPLYTPPSGSDDMVKANSHIQDIYSRCMKILLESEPPARYGALVCALALVQHVSLPETYTLLTIKVTLNHLTQILNENEMRRRVTDRLDGILTHLGKLPRWREIVTAACS